MFESKPATLTKSLGGLQFFMKRKTSIVPSFTVVTAGLTATASLPMAVRADVEHRDRGACLGAVEDELLFGDGALQDRAAELVRSRGDIPGVFRKQGRLSSCLNESAD